MLIDNSVTFLQNYFLSRIASKSIDLRNTEIWYLLTLNQERQHCTVQQPRFGGFEPVRILFKGLLPLLLSSRAPTGFPDTFELEANRLWRLRTQVQDQIRLEVCHSVFRDVLARDFLCSRLPANLYSIIEPKIRAIIENGDLTTNGGYRWEDNIELILLEIARVAACYTSNCTQVPPPSPLSDETLLQSIRAKLVTGLTHDSPLFRQCHISVWERLETFTLGFAKTYHIMSPLTIANSQESTTQLFLDQKPKERDVGLIDVAKRVAHIGTLNWRIWAPLVYNREGA